MDTTATTTTSREEELAATKVILKAVFAAQDVWEATGCAVGNKEHKTYKAAFSAYRAARSAYINS